MPSSNGVSKNSDIRSWSVSDTISWLRQDGLDEYVELFEREEIDGEVNFFSRETSSSQDFAFESLNFTLRELKRLVIPSTLTTCP